MSLIYNSGGTFVGGRRQRHGIYLGGKSDAKSRDKLERWGVTHILNVTPEKEAGVKSGIANFFESSGSFSYKRIPVYDASTSDLLSHADSVVSFISSGLHHGSVFVHCQRGVSRSVTCVVFYLMRKVGMTFEEAMTLVRKQRPEAEPIPAFMSQLKEYEKKCRQLGVIRKGDDVREKKRKAQQQDNGHDVKRRIGPAMGPEAKVEVIGPSIGPARGAEGKEVVIGPSIGPSLPPSATGEKSVSSVPIGPAVVAIDEKKKPIVDPSTQGSALAREKASTGNVGPLLPDQKSLTRPSDDEAVEKPTNTKAVYIGPAPPHKTEKQS